MNGGFSAHRFVSINRKTGLVGVGGRQAEVVRGGAAVHLREAKTLYSDGCFPKMGQRRKSG
jgi:hypothetical protein